MARTPLLSRLLARLRLARAARARGMSIDELVERRRTGPSRREFLAGSAALVGAAGFAPLLPGCGESDGGGGSPRIAIVGGGLAGLHCAYRLWQAGVRPVVYESSDRIGGRIYTDGETFAPSQHAELGGELIDSGHTTMHDLASELSISLFDYTTDDPALRPLTAHFDGAILTDQQILDGFVPIAAAIDEALLGLDDQKDLFVYWDKPNGGEALDALSIKAWFDQKGFSGPVRELLEVAYNIEYGREVDDQNVLNLMFLISTETDAFRIFGDSDERYHARFGNSQFIDELRARLDESVFALGHQLVAVRESGDRYRLDFQTGGGSLDLEVDHVIFALPFTRLREVDLSGVEAHLRPEKRRAIDELGYGTNAKLMVGFDTRPWREAQSNGETYTDLGYQATWETSRLQPTVRGILTNFVGGNRGVAMGEGTPEERAAEFLAQLDVVFPGAAAAYSDRVARFHWPSHPHTKASYSCYRVGQYTQMAGVEGLSEGPMERLHFCGEHTSLDAQGYMEGAALSGAAVADEVLAALGVDAEKQFAARAGLVHPAVSIMRRARAVRSARGRRLRRVAAARSRT